MSEIIDGTHRRFNPLSGQWVLVAAGRDKRPWNGDTAVAPVAPGVRYDPSCYLCPGNRRAKGEVNPEYESTFVFTNDFAAIAEDRVRIPGGAPSLPGGAPSLLRAKPVSGTCRVLCFSPCHNRRLSVMSRSELRAVVNLWCDQHAELSDRWQWVQIFENQGPEMGASNPHPHGQIWASDELPTEVLIEAVHQQAYWANLGSTLLGDYLAYELRDTRRLVTGNERWQVIVPFWASWPFETVLVPQHALTGFDDLADTDREDLADVLGRLLRGYDELFDRPFPYSMGWHPAPKGHNAARSCRLHAHFYPPLLRADTRNFMVGYELLAEAQRDLTPETAAARLRAAVDAVC